MDMKLRVAWFAWMMMVPFVWYTLQARRTFLIPDSGGPGLVMGGLSMISGFVLCGWNAVHGTFSQGLWAGGAILAFVSVALYESARRVVTGRSFYSVFSGVVPPAICTDGPYRYIRHPVYTSYLLAFLAVAVAFPGWPGAAVLAANAFFFVFAAANEERTIAHSEIAQPYAAYRRTAGMFFPRLRRAD